MTQVPLPDPEYKSHLEDADDNALRNRTRKDSSTRNNALCIGIGLVLLAAGATLRYFSSGKFDIKAADILLLITPTLLWLLASGQLESFKFGTGGFQVKSAIQNASSKPASLEMKVKGIDIPKINISLKGELDELNNIVESHPAALSFMLRKNEAYYSAYVLSEYIKSLSKLPDFRYFIFFGPTAARPFLGGIGSTQFCQSLNLSGNQDDPSKGVRMSLDELADILNGNGEFARITTMPGYVSIEKALRKNDDTRTALASMADIGTDWLPVRERYSLLGIVERSALAASLVLDVANALSGAVRKG